MTLQEATESMTAALCDRDLPAVSAALMDRAASIKAGAQPTPEIVQAGSRAMYDLLILKQCLAFESARLEQMRTRLAGSLPQRKRALVDYHG